jgi:hypothetical protein
MWLAKKRIIEELSELSDRVTFSDAINPKPLTKRRLRRSSVMLHQQDDFDSLMSRMNDEGTRGSFCTAMVDVADAAYACKLWFENNGLRPTVADVVAMARLVLEREAELKVAPMRRPIDQRSAGALELGMHRASER